MSWSCAYLLRPSHELISFQTRQAERQTGFVHVYEDGISACGRLAFQVIRPSPEGVNLAIRGLKNAATWRPKLRFGGTRFWHRIWFQKRVPKIQIPSTGGTKMVPFLGTRFSIKTCTEISSAVIWHPGGIWPKVSPQRRRQSVIHRRDPLAERCCSFFVRSSAPGEPIFSALGHNGSDNMRMEERHRFVRFSL